jgi:superfamily I DNA/RNA helicase
MSWDYLLQEINQVIIGRGIDQELDYLTEPRDGRRVRLNEGQRSILWEISQRFVRAIREHGTTTYPLLVLDASRKVAGSRATSGYDAVFVDEAQDLSPTAIRMLVELARDGNGLVRDLYLSADGDQTIYGSSYSWVSIHPDLRLQGRARRLKTNYRSTGQIVEAARAYLSGASLEKDWEAPAYLHAGPAPIALRVGTETRELEEIASYLRQSCAEIGRDFGDCALLVATKDDGKRFATALKRAGIEAKFMSRGAVDLTFPGVKVTTRHTAKGLEFPIVVVSLRQDRMRTQSRGEGDERQESNLLSRRVNHMAMTRAMRSLLVTLPLSDNEQTSGITSPLWTIIDTRRLKGGT